MTINGTYERSEVYDAMRAIYYDADPKTTEGKALIERWFTEATYIGETDDSDDDDNNITNGES